MFSYLMLRCIGLRRLVCGLLLVVPVYVTRSASATQASTVFSANVPFECVIQNNNTGPVSMNFEESTLRADAVKLTATSESLEISGNGLADVTFDYTQTQGSDAFYTFMTAGTLLDSGFNAAVAGMQNGSTFTQMEGGFPVLTSTSRPITIYFRADVLNVVGETYEFEVTLTCLQRSE